MARMKPETERAFLEDMLRLAGACVTAAETESDQDFYADQHRRWLDRLVRFESRIKAEKSEHTVTEDIAT